MPTRPDDQQEPWYRNPWVWLVIAIPGLTMVGYVFTIYLALSQPDYIVSDTVTGNTVTDDTVTGKSAPDTRQQ